MRDQADNTARVEKNARFRDLWWVFSVVIALSSASLTAARFWIFSAPYPPGLDGAQWLAYGRALFGGAGRSADSTYAPLVPFLAHGLSVGAGPILGLRLMAVIAIILLCAAIWLLAVSVLSIGWGSLATALVLPSTAMAEPYFYGGYPQQVALAFGVFGVLGIVSAKRAPSAAATNRALTFAGVCFLLSSASHLLYGPLLLVSGGLVALLLFIERRDRRFLILATICLAPSAFVSMVMALTFAGQGYAAPLSISRRTIPEAWTYATREAPLFWACIVLGGALIASVVVVRHWYMVSRHKDSPGTPLAVVVAIAFVVPAGVVFLASGQPRLVPPILMGGAIMTGFACRIATDKWSHLTLPVATSLCAAILWLAVTTTNISRGFADYYLVLGDSLIAAVQSVPPADPGAIAVAQDRRGWPIGWWVEALQERPVYTGSNLQWLAFPEERDRAVATSALLASPSAKVLRERAHDLGVDYLIASKWDWIGWDRWLNDAVDAPVIVYDDDETIVLRIAPLEQ